MLKGFKPVYLLLIVLMIFSLNACKNKPKKIEQKVTVYNQETFVSAASDGENKIADWFSHKEIIINGLDKHGSSALTVASKNGRLETVKILVDKGADVNVTDNDGDTPLMCAAFAGNLGTVKFLLSKGANPTLKSNNGWTAYIYASEKGYTEVAELLKPKK
ncbi:MAG: ankyrin repeat domain-containing protein [Nitrospirae bacterium]|nr:ankyrin repeat domain-containing protein [Nitrospirota bacterium]